MPHYCTVVTARPKGTALQIANVPQPKSSRMAFTSTTLYAACPRANYFFSKRLFIGLIIIRNIKCSACSTSLPSSVCFFVCSNVKEEGQGYHLKKLKQHQLDGFSPMFAHVFTASWFHSFQLESLGSPFRRIATCISITLGS